MIYGNQALAKHRIERCYEALADSEMLLKNGSTSGALQVCLRATKEAVEAALLAAGNENIKTESLLFLAVQMVKDRKLTQNSFNAFRTLMDLCQFANTRDFSIVSNSEVMAAVESAKYFMREMGEIVKDLKT